MIWISDWITFYFSMLHEVYLVYISNSNKLWTILINILWYNSDDTNQFPLVLSVPWWSCYCSFSLLYCHVKQFCKQCMHSYVRKTLPYFPFLPKNQHDSIVLWSVRYVNIPQLLGQNLCLNYPVASCKAQSDQHSGDCLAAVLILPLIFQLPCLIYFLQFCVLCFCFLLDLLSFDLLPGSAPFPLQHSSVCSFCSLPAPHDYFCAQVSHSHNWCLFFAWSFELWKYKPRPLSCDTTVVFVVDVTVLCNIN